MRNPFSLIHSNIFSHVDDDASTSSTVSVNLVTKKQVPSKRIRRTVCFNEEANQLYDNTQWFEEDTYMLWYTAEELQECKDEYVDNIKRIVKIESRNQERRSYTAVFRRVYEACCDAELECEEENIPATDEKLFNRWVEATPCRVGLEKTANRVIGRDKHARRSLQVEAVLRLQEEWDQNDLTTELIRQECQSISRPSRLFARRLAVAQAQAK